MVGMDQARFDRRRRYPDRRFARSRQFAQYQEHLRSPEGIAAERSRAAVLSQPGRRAETPRDQRQRIRQGDRKPADRVDSVRPPDVRLGGEQWPDDCGNLRQSSHHEMFLQIAQRLTGRRETKKPPGTSFLSPLIEKLRAKYGARPE